MQGIACQLEVKSFCLHRPLRQSMALSESQKISLAVVPKISSCLSFFGSAWIVLEVAGDREKQKQMYHRLMGMFALVDGIVSVFYFLSTWPMHDDNDGDVVWSQGNTSTCRLQGFFVQFGSSAFIYVSVPFYGILC